MREEDRRNDAVLPEHWLMDGLIRELDEELALDISDDRLCLRYLIHDETDQRKFRHLCIVYEIVLSGDTECVISGKEHRERLGTSLSGKFLSVEELPRDIDKWDPWGLKVLHALYNWQPEQGSLFGA